jgi:CRP-like cAMP-binding protein
MKAFINHLLLFDQLNDQQIRLVRQKTRVIHLEAGEYFAEAGIIFGKMAFINDGVLRYNYYNNKAENFTVSLIGDGNIVIGSNPVLPNFPPSDYLQAITRCSLCVIEAYDMAILAATISNWEKLIKKISQKSVLDKKERVLPNAFNTNVESAANAYLNKFENIKKHLSLDKMVSYLRVDSPALSENHS